MSRCILSFSNVNFISNKSRFFSPFYPKTTIVPPQTSKLDSKCCKTSCYFWTIQSVTSQSWISLQVLKLHSYEIRWSCDGNGRSVFIGWLTFRGSRLEASDLRLLKQRNLRSRLRHGPPWGGVLFILTYLVGWPRLEWVLETQLSLWGGCPGHVRWNILRKQNQYIYKFTNCIERYSSKWFFCFFFDWLLEGFL